MAFKEPGAASRLEVVQPQLADLSKHFGLDLRGFSRDLQWTEGIVPLLD